MDEATGTQNRLFSLQKNMEDRHTPNKTLLASIKTHLDTTLHNIHGILAQTTHRKTTTNHTNTNVETSPS